MTWQAGDRIIVRGADWRVVRSTSFSDCEALDLASEHSATTRTLLLPFDRPRLPSSPRFQVVSRRRWAREVASVLQTTYPYGGLRCCTPGIRVLPYQLEPALAMFRYGELRMLIADDVGLGKTIEAALILTELTARSPRSRALILCPASIRAQWAHELARLFRLDVIQADSVWLRRITRDLPPDVNPWGLPAIYLASMDFVKRPEALDPLEHVRWDLLVVDEAHGATPASDRRAAVHALALRSIRLLLLTATPHSGDDDQFGALCGLGAEPGSRPILLFRRSRADTALPRQPPRTVILPVKLSGEERRTHRLLEDYTCRVWRESKTRAETTGQLLATILRKRALSSAACLCLSIRRRLQLLDGAPSTSSQLWLPLDAEDEVIGDHAAGDDVLGRAGLSDEVDEQALLRAVHAAAEAVRSESKLRVLLRLLRRAAQPAIVFTEYRDTAEHIGRALGDAGHDVRVLHGGLPRQDRAAILERFRTMGCLLVATDAASEGLNLHHVCRLVIHFELPWAPLRLQQRCGRVDRIGQTQRVHEIALVADDTCERLVLGPLVQRSSRASAFAGPSLAGHIGESRVAACVFGETDEIDAGPPAAAAVAPRHLDLRNEADDEARRMELLMGLSTPTAERGRTPLIIPVARARRTVTRPHDDLVLLLIVSLRDAAGAPFERLPLVLGIRTDVRWDRRGRALADQVRRVREELRPAIASVVERLGRERAAGWAGVRAAAARGRFRRRREMERQARSAARELVQAGLFDRRAVRAAGVRHAAAESQLDDLLAQDAPESEDIDCRAEYDIAAFFVGGIPQ